MNKYIFIHKGPEGIQKLVVKDMIVAEDLVRSFKYFMLAMSFHETTVINAMESIAAEYRYSEEENEKDIIEKYEDKIAAEKHKYE